MTSYGYIIMIIVDSCIIWFHLDCIMQLMESYYIATNVCNRKSATTFGDLPDCSDKGLMACCLIMPFNTLRPRQNGRHFPDDIFKCNFLIENIWISIKISLNFVPKGPIINISALVRIMAWRRPGDKPLSEPMMVSLLTHICGIWP